MLKPSIFREYDIRGIADEDLRDDDVVLLGKSLATHLIRHSGRNICLGRDCRLSSARIHAALTNGLLSAGANILDIAVVPTPVLYYAAVHFKTDGAVMITGSHHPPEYNGLKTVCGPGTLHGHEIQQILKLIQDKDFEEGAGTLKEADAVTPYVDEIAAQFRFERKVKAVFDSGNGTAGPVLHRLIKKLNIEATELFREMDGAFPNHPPDPADPENLKHLQDAVKKNKADLGLAFDGDADRLGVLDERGQVLFGDMLLLIFGREILSRKPGSTLIGDVKCSQLVYDKLKESGGNPVMYKTGHSLIKAKMKEVNAELAGEMSGHLFFADRYYGYDDAIYAACRLLEILSKSGQPLSAQFAGLPKRFSTPELRVDCPDDQKSAVVARTAALVAKDYSIIDIDGVRVPFEEGCWGLVRASNTQPVLTLRFEATSQALLNKYRAYLESIVEKAIAATTAPEPKK